MNQKERFVVAGVLAAVAVMVGVDLFTDFHEGVVPWHVILEGLMGAISLFGVYYVLRGSFKLKHRLQDEITAFTAYKKEADAWRAESRKYVDGLAKAIDQQLTKWNLTTSEKEVAFLLLKGLSLKEVADIRNTTEKTARVQSIAIYSKAGLAGRAELSAFFLEDLLLPAQPAEALRGDV